MRGEVGGWVTGRGSPSSAEVGINLQETVVFGDGENDIAMLKEGAVAFAMDTAKQKVKAHAQYICNCVEDVIRCGLDQEKDSGCTL